MRQDIMCPLEAHGGRHGLATSCGNGGQGASAAVERVG